MAIYVEIEKIESELEFHVSHIKILKEQTKQCCLFQFSDIKKQDE